jgi:hypothetical protein
MGFKGGYALMRGYLDQFRVTPDPAASPPPTVRQVTGWLTRHPATPTEDETLHLKAIVGSATSAR